MKPGFPTSCLPAAAFALLLGAGHLHAATGTNKAEVVDRARLLNAAGESAVHVPSLFLSQQEKIQTVETFVTMVGIKSQSRYEDAVRDMLRQRLTPLDAHEIVCDRHEASRPLNLETPDPPLTNAPLNLIMEIPATRDFEGKPAVILNAHMDPGGAPTTSEPLPTLTKPSKPFMLPRSSTVKLCSVSVSGFALRTSTFESQLATSPVPQTPPPFEISNSEIPNSRSGLLRTSAFNLRTY